MGHLEIGDSVRERALIFGISGQDGSYLSEFLVENEIEVHGVVRRHSIAENQDSRLKNIENLITTHYGDVTDFPRTNEIIKELKPKYIFNLAAQSHVRVSFDVPSFTLDVNSKGTLNILEAVKNVSKESKFYQASSSEMFGIGVDSDGKQRETTQMLPVSPYGCAKLYSYHITRTYRESHTLFASNGILFNHESPRRGSNFVTSKVIMGAVSIKLGRSQELVLGNLDSQRDWGHSKDYVRAMKLILDFKEAEDFVVATGETRSIRDLCKVTFDLLDLQWEDFVKQDQKYFRPQELPYLCGDPSKAKRVLGWKPEISFDEMVQEMVEYWFKKLA